MPEVVFSSVSPGASLEQLQEVQHLPNHCSMLKFNLFTTEVSESFSLCIYIQVFNILKQYNQNIIMFNISTIPCPFGFQLKGEPPQCECMKLLTDNHCKCTKNKTYTYTCPERFWIKNELDNVYKYGLCPFHFCMPMWVGPKGTNDKCSSNRTGILCGGCKPDSSMLSNHCV